MNDLENISAIIDGMAAQLEELVSQTGRSSPAMVGIHTGGVWIARQLHARLGIHEPMISPGSV
jgi:pyrimidine operon attenuation protein/uracil phosphoribosyltransferase